MHKLPLLLLTIVFCLNAFSQEFINRKKNFIKKRFEIELIKGRSTLKETDSTLIFNLNDPTVRPFTEIFHFNNSGKCESDTRILDCDSCFRKFLNKVLDLTSYQWQKVSPTLYVSRFSKHLIIEIIIKDQYAFVIKKSDLNRDQYNELLKSGSL